MLDLKDLGRWTPVADGEVAIFAGGEARSVTVEIRPEGAGLFWLVGPARERLFLICIDQPYFKLGFRLPGPDWGIVSDVPFHMSCMEFRLAARPMDSPVFTRIAERPERNPELERMMQLMQVNMERRMSAMAAEIERRADRRVAAVTATAVKPGGKANDKKSDTLDAGVDDAAKAAKARDEVGGGGAKGGGNEKPPAAAPDADE